MGTPMSLPDFDLSDIRQQSQDAPSEPRGVTIPIMRWKSRLKYNHLWYKNRVKIKCKTLKNTDVQNTENTGI